MKKGFLVLALLATGMIANAQFYLGGSFGLNVSSGKTSVESEEEKDPTRFGLTVSPNIGWIVGDKWEIGGYINLSSYKTTSYSYDANHEESESEAKSFSWNVSPYARFKAFEANKFAVLIEGAVNVGSSKNTYDEGDETIEEPASLSYGINFRPMLTYSLNENIRLETGLNFLGFGFNGTFSKEDEDGVTTKTSSHSFGLNVDSKNVVSVSDITIGFVYIF